MYVQSLKAILSLPTKVKEIGRPLEGRLRSDQVEDGFSNDAFHVVVTHNDEASARVAWVRAIVFKDVTTEQGLAAYYVLLNSESIQIIII